jgi:hypothetical protein
MKKWYWSGKLSPQELEWPNDGLPIEIQPMPRRVLASAAIAVAIVVAYAVYVFVTT